jgi:conjugal transfer pilus assembly protein TraK
MYSASKKWLRPSLVVLLLSSSVVQARQLIENSHKEQVLVNVSARETNRLAVEGRRIVNVVPGQAGMLKAKKDEAQGALYFSVDPEAKTAATLTLFVDDDKGVTYKLLLVPRAVSGGEIILRPPVETLAANRTTRADGRAASYARRVKDLVLLMSDSELQDNGGERIEINKEVPLWKEGKLVLDSKYLMGDFVGEKYRLTNVSNTDMLLVEQELYRRGVRAVSIKNQTLAPGNSTEIYIVRKRNENE